jgi:hypothetical protein
MSELPIIGGFFKQILGSQSLLIDSKNPPQTNTQEVLKSEVEDYETILLDDYNYCMNVEGSSQESNLWISRNLADSGFAESDLQRFKNVAWNECVVKKFLANKEGNSEIIGKSMINIIRSLNLQWKNFQVMGLHPKVESAEKQIVMHVMEKGLVPFDHDVGKIARIFRRCKHFNAFFANAVGGQIVANSGRTPGLAKTMYGQDLDYAYRNKALFFFESALQRMGVHIVECIQNTNNVDYVARLSDLKIVTPDSSSSVELNVPYSEMPKPMILPGYTRSNDNASSGGTVNIMPNADNIVDLLERRLEKGLQLETSTFLENVESEINRLTKQMAQFSEQNKTEIESNTHRLNETMVAAAHQTDLVRQSLLSNVQLLQDHIRNIQVPNFDIGPLVDRIRTVQNEMETNLKLYDRKFADLTQRLNGLNVPDLGQPLRQLHTDLELLREQIQLLPGQILDQMPIHAFTQPQSGSADGVNNPASSSPQASAPPSAQATDGTKPSAPPADGTKFAGGGTFARMPKDDKRDKDADSNDDDDELGPGKGGARLRKENEMLVQLNTTIREQEQAFAKLVQQIQDQEEVMVRMIDALNAINVQEMTQQVQGLIDRARFLLSNSLLNQSSSPSNLQSLEIQLTRLIQNFEEKIRDIDNFTRSQRGVGISPQPSMPVPSTDTTTNTRLDDINRVLQQLQRDLNALAMRPSPPPTLELRDARYDYIARTLKNIETAMNQNVAGSVPPVAPVAAPVIDPQVTQDLRNLMQMVGDMNATINIVNGRVDTLRTDMVTLQQDMRRDIDSVSNRIVGVIASSLPAAPAPAPPAAPAPPPPAAPAPPPFVPVPPAPPGTSPLPGAGGSATAPAAATTTLPSSTFETFLNDWTQQQTREMNRLQALIENPAWMTQLQTILDSFIDQIQESENLAPRNVRRRTARVPDGTPAPFGFTASTVPAARGRVRSQSTDARASGAAGS